MSRWYLRADNQEDYNKWLKKLEAHGARWEKNNNRISTVEDDGSVKEN